MAFSFTTANYGVRFPEICGISNFEEVRRDRTIVVDVRRVGYDVSIVLGRHVYMLIGNLAEKIPHVKYEDPRWRPMESSSGYVWSPVDGQNARFVVSSDAVLSSFEEDMRDAVWEEICSGQRALYFMVVERISKSYAGLTDLAVVPYSGGVMALSTKEAVVNDKWYGEGGVVWTATVRGNVLRATVDLAQRLDAGQYRPDYRTVWVTAMEGGDCILMALDYWTGRTLARKTVASESAEVNAIAVNPKDGMVWFVVPHRGNITVCGAKLNRSVGSIAIPVSRNITSPNARYTQKYPMIPADGTASEIGRGLTGGRVSMGPETDSSGVDSPGMVPWFTFVVNSEATISVKMSSPYTVRWADRSHFGSWHGRNSNFGPWSYRYANGKSQQSYRRNEEYGVDPGTRNVQGICCGILGAVYANGHPYYHHDDRVLVDRKFTGYRMTNNHICGKVFSTYNVYYPSYVIDPSTGGYQTVNGKPVVVKKKINQIGYPVNGFYLQFPDDHTDDGWKVVKLAIEQDSKKRYPMGRNCRFGNKSRKGPDVDEATAKKYFGGNGTAKLKKGNASWGDVTDHMAKSEEILHQNTGTFWWQLQDAGLIYGANASLTNTSAFQYASGVSSGFPYATSFYFSTGVCEDNPWQVSGCIPPDPVERTWYDYDSKSPSESAAGTDGYVSGNRVGGFTYQKSIVSGAPSHMFFRAFSPSLEKAPMRPYSESNGWAGWTSKVASPYMYGSSEDWGVNKIGLYNPNGIRGDMVAYASERKPSPPRMSMCGLDETLPSGGELSVFGDRRIVQSDSYDGAVYAVGYESGLSFSPGGSVEAIPFSAALTSAEMADGFAGCDNVSVDDANRVIVGHDRGASVFVNHVGDAWDYQYHNAYVDEQFPSLGNHNNTGSRWHEAVQLSKGAYVDRRTAVEIARESSAGVIAGMANRSMYSVATSGWHALRQTSHLGMMNGDQTGMDAVKTLGYCYTLKTAAHPVVVYPSGHLLIVDRPKYLGTGPCDVGSGYWDKSVVMPTFLDDVDDEPTRSHIANVVYPRREDAYDMAVATLGTSAAAYQTAVTRHVLDVFPSGSMVVRTGTLKFFDGGEQNRTSDKRERGLDVPLRAGDGGYFAVYDDPVGWNGVTVFGKPISTSAAFDVDEDGTAVRKLYREGQLTPSGNVFELYPSVRPELFTRSRVEVQMADHDDVWAQYNEGGSGFVEPNRVEFWVKLAGDVYADEVRAEKTDVMFGVNYVHAYERWSTPGFCPYVSSPDSGKEIFGECQ